MYSSMRVKGFKPGQFVETYNEASFVLPIASIGRLLLVTGSWVGHEADIELVVGSSSLDREMFQYAVVANLSHSTGILIEQLLQQHLGSGALAVQAVANVCSATRVALGKKHACSTMGKPRVVEVKYGRCALNTKVNSVWDELNLRLGCFLKMAGVSA